VNAVDATSPVSHFWFNHERNRVHFAMVIPALFHDVVRENEIGNLIAQRPQRTAVLGFRKVPIVPAVPNVPIVEAIKSHSSDSINLWRAVPNHGAVKVGDSSQ